MAKEYHLSDLIKDTVSSHTILSYSKPGVSEQYLHALEKGKIPWEAELNLSSLAIEPARRALCLFLQNQVKNNKRCVLIIHGTGQQREASPLIKNLINCWLPQFKEVQAFHSAQIKDGGYGAVYVLLKNPISTEPPVRLPKDSSFLVAETKSMERKRRLAEQDGERRLARVNAREHPDAEASGNSLEEAAQNGMLQHPDLDNQRFDGIDPNLNPEPALNTEARREYDNEKRNQEQEKQYRLGNMPKFSSTPTPRGPQ